MVDPDGSRSQRLPSAWWRWTRNCTLFLLAAPVSFPLAVWDFGPLPDNPVSGGPLWLSLLTCYFATKWTVEGVEYMMWRHVHRTCDCTVDR